MIGQELQFSGFLLNIFPLTKRGIETGWNGSSSIGHDTRHHAPHPHHIRTSSATNLSMESHGILFHAHTTGLFW
jgi:hypothetical protein